MKDEITMTCEEKRRGVMDIEKCHENLRKYVVELQKDREKTCQGKEIASLNSY